MKLWEYIKPPPNQVKVGDTMTIPMKSGRLGVYVLIEVDYSTHWSSDVDWEWYILRFIKYESEVQTE
jgi:hypothetical protein